MLANRFALPSICTNAVGYVLVVFLMSGCTRQPPEFGDAGGTAAPLNSTPTSASPASRSGGERSAAGQSPGNSSSPVIASSHPVTAAISAQARSLLAEARLPEDASVQDLAGTFVRYVAQMPEEVPQKLIILFDATLTMSMRDQRHDLSRWEAACKEWKTVAPRLHERVEVGTLRVVVRQFGAADTLEPFDPTQAPYGDAMSIYDAFTETFSAARGGPPTAVLIVSDWVNLTRNGDPHRLIELVRKYDTPVSTLLLEHDESVEYVSTEQTRRQERYLRDRAAEIRRQVTDLTGGAIYRIGELRGFLSSPQPEQAEGVVTAASIERIFERRSGTPDAKARAVASLLQSRGVGSRLQRDAECRLMLEIAVDGEIVRFDPTVDFGVQFAKEPLGRHHVVLLDVSESMRASSRGSQSCNRAEMFVERLAGDATPYDAFTLILLAEKPELVASCVDARALIRALRSGSHPPHEAHLAGAFEQAVTAVLNEKRPATVYVVSDLPATLRSDAPMVQTLQEKLPEHTELRFVDVGSDATSNTAIVDLEANASRTEAGTVCWTATVTNFSAMPTEAAWKLAQPLAARVLEEGSVTLAPYETRRLAGELPSDSLKSILQSTDSEASDVLQLRLETDDALSADDARSIVVGKAPHVLIVSDDAVEGDRSSAASIWRRALRPGPDSAAVRDVTTVSPSQLPDQQLDSFDAVIFADCLAPNGDDARRLESWIRRGGGVLFLIGPKTNVDAYNELFDREAGGPLPARLLNVVRRPSTLAVAAPEHPLNLPWREVPAALDQVLVSQYVRLDEPRGKEAAAVLRIDHGDAALIVAPLGLGRTAVFNAGGDWTNLEQTVAQVILACETVAYLAAPRTNGRRREFQTLAQVPIPSAGGAAVVRLPDGSRVEAAPVPGSSEIEFSATEQTGPYVAEFPRSQTAPFVWTIRGPLAESDVRRLPRDEFGKLFPNWRVVESEDADGN